MRYNQFPLGDFFARNITLKMGQAPATAYAKPLLGWVRRGKINPTDIITHRLPLDEAQHGYEVFDEKKEDCIKVIMRP